MQDQQDAVIGLRRLIPTQVIRSIEGFGKSADITLPGLQTPVARGFSLSSGTIIRVFCHGLLTVMDLGPARGH